MLTLEVVNFAQTQPGNEAILGETRPGQWTGSPQESQTGAGKGAIALSERNGDKSRFGRLRKKKILRRKRNRELCEALSAPGPRVTARQKKQASRAHAQA